MQWSPISRGARGKRRCRFFKRKAISQTGFWWPGAIRAFPCSPGMFRPPASNWFLRTGTVRRRLALLKEGCVHVAGTHLRDEASGESNLPEIGRLFPKNSVAVIAFAVWEEGIVTARGNPKSIRGIEDFARKDVSIVNREPGSGSRALLDSRLERLRIAPRAVRGYEQLAPGHLPAAWQVQSGAVDCCLATRAAARMFGLNFIPLVSERYDLVIRKQHLDLPPHTESARYSKPVGFSPRTGRSRRVRYAGRGSTSALMRRIALKILANPTIY